MAHSNLRFFTSGVRNKLNADNSKRATEARATRLSEFSALKMSRLTPLRSARTLFTGALVSILAYTLWTSRLLRPIADDYVYGVISSEGLFQSVTYLWYNWSGAITDSFVGSLLVGLPLAFLPWPLASSISFLTTAVVMVSLNMRLQTTWGLATSTDMFRGSFLVRFTALLAAWWGYWWLPISPTPVASENYAIALAATHWQTVVSKYSMTFGLLVWMWLTVQNWRTANRWYWIPTYIVSGLIVGFNHSVLAIASVIFIFVYSVCVLLRERGLSNKFLMSLLIGIGSAAGATWSHFSPGSRYRESILADTTVDFSLVRQLTLEVVPAAVKDWALAITGWNSLVVVVVIGGVTYLFAPRVNPKEAKSLARTSCVILGFALVYSLASRAGQLFAYEAFWHAIGPRSAVWLGLTVLATSVGALLAHHSETVLTRLVVACVLTIGVYFLVGAIDLMNRQIIDRYEPWQLGPAAVYDISDTENEDWMGWWLELRSLRDAPERVIP
jgi:hypothetical protein